MVRQATSRGTYLLDAYGVDALKAVYVRDDVDQAFEDELGATTADLESAWLATLTP